ncbi:MAG: AraC family transcriptional regulator [Monoglobaceae bacterium]
MQYDDRKMSCGKTNDGNIEINLVVIPDTKSRIDDINTFSEILHEEIEIKLFYEGNATLLIKDHYVNVSEGDIVVINPYEFHSTIDVGKGSSKYHLIMIGLDFYDYAKNSILDLRRLFINERMCINNIIHNDKRLERIICDIVKEYENRNEMFNEVLYSLVTEFFCLLLRSYKRPNSAELPSAKKIKNYEIIYPAIVKIRNDYRERLNIDELASICNISKYYFCRIFKYTTSLSALQYQTEYRIQMANILLKNTNKSISEIAAFCGFDDVCYFSRCYKKHTGISPKKSRAIMSK